eukprot:2076546-Amphidinium_carterae.1
MQMYTWALGRGKTWDELSHVTSSSSISPGWDPVISLSSSETEEDKEKGKEKDKQPEKEKDKEKDKDTEQSKQPRKKWRKLAPAGGDIIVMGKGRAWTAGEEQLLRAYIDQNKGPAFIVKQHPTWSLSTVKKAIMKLKSGKVLRNYKGQPGKFGVAQQDVVAATLAASSSSLRTIASELQTQTGTSVCRSSVSRFMKRQGQRSVKKVRAFRLQAVHRERRLVFARTLLARLRLTTRRVHGKCLPAARLAHIVFSDEKLFRQEKAGHSTQNERLWIKKDDSKRALLQAGSRDLRMEQ